MTSTIEETIIKELESNDGMLLGTEKTALKLNTKKWQMIKRARLLADNDILMIIKSPGGRGRMTIYRCPLSKCTHCPRLTCSRRPTRAELGYPRRARKPR